jgi:hypothetical protein
MKMAMQMNTFRYLPGDAASEQLFCSGFDRDPFGFAHQLHRSPSFSYDALLDLAERVSHKSNRWYFDEGDTRPEKGWTVRNTSRTLVESLKGIADNHALIMLKRVQEEPEYQDILRVLEAELSRLTGIDMASRYRDGLMTILISSPKRVTPYHIDGEANLLMQMSGTKSVYIFDGNNREVLPSSELEKFWSGDIHAPVYREHLQDRAWRFELAPGLGVSNPVIFPHWVQNGPEVSVSLSVNFKRCVDNAADAYRVNRQLRKIGLHPTEPGTAKFVDHTKGVVYRAARRVKRGLASLSSKPA